MSTFSPPTKQMDSNYQSNIFLPGHIQSLKTSGGTSPPFRSEVLHRDFDNGTGLGHMIKGHMNKRKYISKFKKQTIEPFETLNPYD